MKELKMSSNHLNNTAGIREIGLIPWTWSRTACRQKVQVITVGKIAKNAEIIMITKQQCNILYTPHPHLPTSMWGYIMEGMMRCWWWRGVGGWVEFFGGELVGLSWSTRVIAVDTTLDFLNHKRDNKISCMNYNYDTWLFNLLLCLRDLK